MEFVPVVVLADVLWWFCIEGSVSVSRSVSIDTKCPADIAVRDMLSYLLSVIDTFFLSHHELFLFLAIQPRS